MNERSCISFVCGFFGGCGGFGFLYCLALFCFFPWDFKIIFIFSEKMWSYSCNLCPVCVEICLLNNYITVSQTREHPEESNVMAFATVSDVNP